MNKILLSGGITELEKFNEDANIEVLNDSILNAINLGDDLNLNIYVKENANLTLNIFDYALDKNINLYIESYDNSKFNLNTSFISTGKYKMDIKNNIYGNNIKSNVNIRGINEINGNVIINMEAVVAGNTKNNVVNEYARIINKSDNSNVLIPNLIVNTNDVIANHGVSIGNLRDDEIFYLLSKGIDKHSARKLLEEGFILQIMSEEIKAQIKNILLGR